MKCIYFVTEGTTDQVVIEGLISNWLGKEDFIPRHIQPPSSAYAEGLNTNLSEGWKGVLAWCEGKRLDGPTGRDEVIKEADCLVIHTDADVATDDDFKSPAFSGGCPPAINGADWVRNQLSSLFGSSLPRNVVLCVLAQDLEAWVVCALHPDIVDENMPIECRKEPGALLVQRPPHRLVRRKEGRLKKEVSHYKKSLSAIIRGWSNCTTGAQPRCPEAVRFEHDACCVLGHFSK